MTITIYDFKPVAAGALRRFCDVTLPSGMRLHRCTVFAKDGRDGTVTRNASGKPIYEATVSFVDRATQDRWSDAVIEALRAAHPEAVQ